MVVRYFITTKVIDGVTQYYNAYQISIDGDLLNISHNKYDGDSEYDLVTINDRFYKRELKYIGSIIIGGKPV